MRNKLLGQVDPAVQLEIMEPDSWVLTERFHKEVRNPLFHDRERSPTCSLGAVSDFCRRVTRSAPRRGNWLRRQAHERYINRAFSRVRFTYSSCRRSEPFFVRSRLAIAARTSSSATL